MADFRLRSAIAALALSAGSLVPVWPAYAADQSGKFAIRGLGSQSCAAFVAARDRPDDYARFGNWLLGYLTARNRAEANTYDLMPTERGVDFPNVVAVVCSARPQSNLATAAESAITAIRPLRQMSASPLVEIISDGSRISIHQEAVRTLQKALIARQLFGGQADGRPSEAFVAAIKNFQRSERLAATGLPDIDTFIRAIIKR